MCIKGEKSDALHRHLFMQMHHVSRCRSRCCCCCCTLPFLLVIFACWNLSLFTSHSSSSRPRTVYRRCGNKKREKRVKLGGARVSFFFFARNTCWNDDEEDARSFVLTKTRREVKFLIESRGSSGRYTGEMRAGLCRVWNYVSVLLECVDRAQHLSLGARRRANRKGWLLLCWR